LFWRRQYGRPVPSSLHRQKSLSPFKEKISPLLDLIGKYFELLGQLYKRLLTSQDGKETFALKAGLLMSAALVPSWHLLFPAIEPNSPAEIPPILALQIFRATSVKATPPTKRDSVYRFGSIANVLDYRRQGCPHCHTSKVAQKIESSDLAELKRRRQVDAPGPANVRQHCH
jgi:hypothetical protein